jgi:transglutaminase-like putative cysteine protease
LARQPARTLEYTTIDEILTDGLHPFLTTFRERCFAIEQSFYQHYFQGRSAAYVVVEPSGKPMVFAQEHHQQQQQQQWATDIRRIRRITLRLPPKQATLIDVTHVSEFSYDRLITETIMELRLQPRADACQRLHRFELTLDPRGSLSSTVEAFGNVVHHFNFRPPHRQIHAVAYSVVETRPGQIVDPNDVWRFQFLRFDGPVQDIPDVLETAERLRPDDETDPAQVVKTLENLTQYIHDRFEYEQSLTTWRSTVAELVALGAGVCQDFTHDWIAVCRSLGIPARYVSGYVHHKPANAAGPVAATSHAWGEAWIPGQGWLGYDPTNPMHVTPFHVKIAVGRDYRDVPPTKGVFLGPVTERIVVDVSTRLIDGSVTDLVSATGSR